MIQKLLLLGLALVIASCSTTSGRRRSAVSQKSLVKAGTKSRSNDTNNTTNTANTNIATSSNSATDPSEINNVTNASEASALTNANTNINANSNASASTNAATEAAPLPMSAADLRSTDTLLMEAQNLADNKRFAEAILKASMVPEQNPLYSEAQAKIIQFSNEAVQELRKKAAQAFQDAMPVSDPKARAAYLERAKQHLERALASYPHAPEEQLTTVKENLAVISRDLEQIDSDSDTDE